MAAFRRILPVPMAAAAMLLLSSCMKDLPAAPSELTNGVTIYEQADCAGASALLTGDVSDLKDFNGPCIHSASAPGVNFYSDWDDCMSSLKVAPGWRATVEGGRG